MSQLLSLPPMPSVPPVPIMDVIVIRCPSMTVFAWLFMQTAMIAIGLDKDKDWTVERAHSLYFRVYGFSLFWPTLLFGAIVIIYNVRLDSRNKYEMEQMQKASLMNKEIPHQYGMPETELRRAEQMAMNKSLTNKAIGFLIGIIPVCFKMSLDVHNRVSWHWVFVWWYGLFSYYMIMAFQRGNFFWLDQREIDAHEEILYVQTHASNGEIQSQ